MRVGKNKMLVMIVVIAMILSLGTTSLGEELTIEEPVAEEAAVEELVMDEFQDDEEETPQEDSEIEIVIEELVDEDYEVLQEEAGLNEEPISQEPAAGEESVEEAIEVEPLTPELEIIEPVFIEEITPRYVSIHIGVEPDRENYTNGDLVQYDISIENKGTDPISDLDVRDDMGVDEKISYLDSGNRVVITGKYRIDDYNRMESIGNTLKVSAVCEGQRVSGRVGFVVSVDVPLGSISLTNSVRGGTAGSQEFTVLVEGPDNYVNYVELGDSDTVTLRNLFIGDYRITPLECMNFRSVSSEEKISITTGSLNRDVSVEYSIRSTGWFSDSGFQTIEVMEVLKEDIDYSKMELQSNSLDNRSDEIYLDLEPLVTLVEIQVQDVDQPEWEASPPDEDPVEEVTSEPEEIILKEEVTEPDSDLESDENDQAPYVKKEEETAE